MRYDFNLVENALNWEESGLARGSGSPPGKWEGRLGLPIASSDLTNWHEGFWGEGGVEGVFQGTQCFL